MQVLNFRLILGHFRLASFDQMNREELLNELEVALQDNEGLVQQLAGRLP